MFYSVSFNKICKNMYDLMDLVIYYVMFSLPHFGTQSRILFPAKRYF
jgi:hypothetical protein